MFRHGEQINVHEMPDGTFVSTDLQRRRLAALRNNTRYREDIEKAQRQSGSRDKLLFYSRGGRDRVLNSLIRLTQKAENILHATKKGNDDANSSRLIVAP
jgi:hypothetical protein